MNAAPERAREACTSCRRSHKRCTYDENSARCLRCEKRNTECSLRPFVPDETIPAAQPGLPALAPPEPAPEVWDVTPGDSAVSPNFSYQYFLPPPQELYYPPNDVITETTQLEGGYPADTSMILQPPANHHESTQPAMNQDGSYDPLNRVFQ